MSEDQGAASPATTPGSVTEASFPGAEDLATRQQAYKDMNKTAFVLGGSGAIGRILLRQLAESKPFSRVVSIGRRKIDDLEPEVKDYVEEVVVDFDKLEEYADAFSGLHVGFCSFGTLSRSVKAEVFYKIDHDYVMAAAKLARSGGCEHFHFVSSTGANKKSRILYSRTKGEVESEIQELGFERVTIYRPGLLTGERTESRPLESVMAVLFKPITFFNPNVLTTPMPVVSKAMINATILPKPGGAEIYDTRGMFILAGERKTKSKKK